MVKNCGSPPKNAENWGKIAEIAEKLRKNCGKITEKLRTAIPPVDNLGWWTREAFKKCDTMRHNLPQI